MVIGQYAAGGNIYQQIQINHESAKMIAEALLQLQKKNDTPYCVLKNSKERAAHFCLVACNDPEPTIQEGA